ncbi:hypothetical protein [Hydrogenimonas urashimensis]|uniref:hypothetical protein n=1 Tax=Hydrogenimonas urashimensis TaxID=2740515 RepID=UPI0019157D2F|nr:hypothetical protein [Hydrogenimonas urashimensis]
MKKMTAVCLLSAATFCFAGPAGMFGVSYTWGGSIGNGEVGLSAKVISDNKEDKVIAAAGVSYYPWAPVNKFGADVSAGYLFDGVALTAGWDFIQSDWQVAAGYVNTVDDDNDHENASAPPAEEPAEEEPSSKTPPGEGET